MLQQSRSSSQWEPPGLFISGNPRPRSDGRMAGEREGGTRSLGSGTVAFLEHDAMDIAGSP